MSAVVTRLSPSADWRQNERIMLIEKISTSSSSSSSWLRTPPIRELPYWQLGVKYISHSLVFLQASHKGLWNLTLSHSQMNKWPREAIRGHMNYNKAILKCSCRCPYIGTHTSLADWTLRCRLLFTFYTPQTQHSVLPYYTLYSHSFCVALNGCCKESCSQILGPKSLNPKRPSQLTNTKTHRLI